MSESVGCPSVLVVVESVCLCSACVVLDKFFLHLGKKSGIELCMIAGEEFIRNHKNRALLAKLLIFCIVLGMIIRI